MTDPSLSRRRIPQYWKLIAVRLQWFQSDMDQIDTNKVELIELQKMPHLNSVLVQSLNHLEIMISR